MNTYPSKNLFILESCSCRHVDFPRRLWGLFSIKVRTCRCPGEPGCAPSGYSESQDRGKLRSTENENGTAVVKSRRDMTSDLPARDCRMTRSGAGPNGEQVEDAKGKWSLSNYCSRSRRERRCRYLLACVDQRGWSMYVSFLDRGLMVDIGIPKPTEVGQNSKETSEE